MIKLKDLITESSADDIYTKESEIFDAINQFKEVFGRSEWKKNPKINKTIKELYKLEARLGDEIGDL